MLRGAMFTIVCVKFSQLLYNDESHYAECRYDECRFAECRGAVTPIHQAVVPNTNKNPPSIIKICFYSN